MKLWVKILICVVLMNLIGGAGAYFTSSEIPGWYANLSKPAGVPPNWVFGPVWTVLYVMIGIAGALFWHRVPIGEAKVKAGRFFFGQLILNFLWSPVFFGMHQIGWALIIILALLASILITISLFRSLDKLAAGLLVPYVCWVSYASYLNAGYWLLN